MPSYAVAARCAASQHAVPRCNMLCRVAACCAALQHAVPCCNTLCNMPHADIRAATCCNEMGCAGTCLFAALHRLARCCYLRFGSDQPLEGLDRAAELPDVPIRNGVARLRATTGVSSMRATYRRLIGHWHAHLRGRERSGGSEGACSRRTIGKSRGYSPRRGSRARR
jgi:hypothetical protein